MQKVHVENFFRENAQKIDKNFDVSFSSIVFGFIAFSKNFDVSFSSFLFLVLLRFQVLLSNGSSKTHQQNVLPKESCRKVFIKKSTKIQNRFFLGFVLSRFWAFLGE
jgi:hypothetical protein